MTEREKLTAIWPLFGLTLKTPRLELRLSDGTGLADLAAAARTLQPAGEQEFQMSWMYNDSPAMERELLQRYWKSLSTWDSDSWKMKFVIYSNGKPIGLQDIWADHFPTVRSVTTGSWITMKHQSQGLGTEARAGILELAFDKLGAAEALTDYVGDNPKSAGVSKKLGYIDNGQKLTQDRTKSVMKHYMRLSKEDWMKYRLPGIAITGFDLCTELFAPDKQKEA